MYVYERWLIFFLVQLKTSDGRSQKEKSTFMFRQFDSSPTLKRFEKTRADYIELKIHRNTLISSKLFSGSTLNFHKIFSNVSKYDIYLYVQK